MLRIIPLLLIVLALSGCSCMQEAQTYAEVPSARVSAQDTIRTTHSGCSGVWGFSCGGESITSGRIDFPNPGPFFRTIMGWLFGGAAPFTRSQAVDDPCVQP